MPKPTAADIILALQRLHTTDWVFFSELRVGTGFSTNADQRIDAWAMHTLPSKKYERIAYEVKVSRGDFQHEMKRPQKRRHALLFSNRFYFAAPEGLIKAAELPPEAGLIEYVQSESGSEMRVTIQAPWRDPIGASWAIVASVLRRAEGKEVAMLKSMLEDSERRYMNAASKVRVLEVALNRQ